jgi:hypothetical protein
MVLLETMSVGPPNIVQRWTTLLARLGAHPIARPVGRVA